MKHVLLTAIALVISQTTIAQNNDLSFNGTLVQANDYERFETKKLVNWGDVEIINDESVLKNYVEGEKLTITHKQGGLVLYSGKEEREAIKKLKKEALDKGYTVVKIDQVQNRLKGLPKKRYRLVNIVAVGYKQRTK